MRFRTNKEVGRNFNSTILSSQIESVDWSLIENTPTTLSGYGITDAVPSSRTLTINGTTFDLSANRTWSVGTITSITASSPLTGGTITSSGSIGITQATTTTSGYLSSTDWNTFNNKQGALTLTTTGTSGAATLVTNTLNIPNYTLSGLGGQPLSTNLTSLAGLTYASASFVKMTASGTFTLDTNSYYLSSNPSGYTNNTGTVTSVAALTLGTTGTDLSSSVATNTTTPVITLNVPTASATNRGALSSADWILFNSKQSTITLTTTGTSGAATLVGTTLNIPQYQSVITNPVTGTGTANQIAYWTSTSAIGSLSTATYPSLTELSYIKGVTSAIQTQINAKFTLPSLTNGSILFSDGTTIAQNNVNFFWDNANQRLGIGTAIPSAIFHSVGTVNSASLIGRGAYFNNTIVATANNDVLIGMDINPTFTNGAFTGVSNIALRVTGTASISSSLTANSIIKSGGTSSQFLKADGSVDSTTYGTFTLPSLTSGSVLFSNGTTISQNNANLFWDNTNTRLGVNTNSPESSFHVKTSISGVSRGITSDQITSDAQASIFKFRKSRAGSAVVSADNISSIVASGFDGTNFITTASINSLVSGTVSTGTIPTDLTFSTGTTSAIERARITSSGIMLIGTSTIFASELLQVNSNIRAINSALIGGGTNASALITSGYLVNGTNVTPILDLDGTWNSSTANPTAIKLNITNTASGPSSKLMDLQIGGVSQFSVDKNGYGYIVNRLGVGVSPTIPLDIVRGTAGTMARDFYESAAFSYNGDTKLGIYTSSTTATDGSAVYLGQTNLLNSSSKYGGFELQYRYNSSTTEDFRINYLSRNSNGSVDVATSLQNILGISKAGSISFGSYTSTTSFPGSGAVGYLGFDGSGNILTSPKPVYSIQFASHSVANFTWIASTNYYIGSGHSLNISATQGVGAIRVPRGGTIKAAYVEGKFSTAGSNQSWTMSILINGSTATSISSTAVSATARSWSNASLNISVAAGDLIEIRSNATAWTTAPVSNAGYGINGIVLIE